MSRCAPALAALLLLSPATAQVLCSDRLELSPASGGRQRIVLEAGAGAAGATYLLLGSASGTLPGFQVAGLTVPLNPDPYLVHTATAPGIAPLIATLGTLDAAGTAHMRFDLPPLGAMAPAVAGTSLQHAALVLDSASLVPLQVTSPIPLRLVEPEGYWRGVARPMATTPGGHVAAISSHNCYVDSGSGTPALNLLATLVKIHNAQNLGADLIELDVKEEGGVIHVDHNDDGGTEGAYLASVLLDPALRSGDQILFVEIKERNPTPTFLSNLLDLFINGGYATAGRPLVLRAFNSIRGNLTLLASLLATPTYAPWRDHIRIHELFNNTNAPSAAGFQSLILQSFQDGFEGVEFQYRTPNLASLLVYARSLGLGINLWTIPSSFGEAYVAAMRDEVDVLTVDYPVDLSRAVVEDDNELLYLNVADQDPATGYVSYRRLDGLRPSIATGTPGAPDHILLPAGGTLFGHALAFDPAGSEFLRFEDADNDPADGFLVVATVRFATLSLATGATMEILGKADSAAFALELYGEASGTVLRYGVHVNGTYRYATLPASALDTAQSYILMGAYDGNGGVRLWVNHSDAGTTTTSVTGGVTQNDSPILLGADPQGPTGARFFFDGWIQQALVQKWADH